MKKIIIFCLVVLIFSLPGFSQKNGNAVKMTPEKYLEKSYRQKSGAWVLLGSGMAFMAVGNLIGNSKESTFDDAGIGVIFGGIGVLSMLGSIPIFMASAHNKHLGKAMTTSIIFENSEMLTGTQLLRKYYPAISLKWKLP